MRTTLPLLGLIAACGGDATTTPNSDTPTPVVEEVEVVPEVTQDVVAPPAVTQIPENFAAMSDEEKMVFLMQFGEHIYLQGGSAGPVGMCVTCHQADGEGLSNAFPPLKGAKDFMGDCKTHAGHVINGVTGEIVVAGQTFNSTMPPLAALNNMEIAAVITYERNSWGNDYGLCLPAAVAAARN